MGSKLLNKLVSLLFALFCTMYVAAQDTIPSDTARVSREDFMPMHWALHSIGLDMATDVSHASTIRIGFASSWQEWSCALGPVSNGTTAGISYSPTTNACGVYFGRWLTLAIVDLGFRCTYETNMTHQWSTIQPQIGLGYGLFRLTYNYNIPFFFGSRFPDFQRHALGIAYTFPIEKKEKEY